jgi:hypothetical protein
MCLRVVGLWWYSQEPTYSGPVSFDRSSVASQLTSEYLPPQNANTHTSKLHGSSGTTGMPATWAPGAVQVTCIPPPGWVHASHQHHWLAHGECTHACSPLPPCSLSAATGHIAQCTAGAAGYSCVFNGNSHLHIKTHVQLVGCISCSRPPLLLPVTRRAVQTAAWITPVTTKCTE